MIDSTFILTLHSEIIILGDEASADDGGTDAAGGEPASEVTVEPEPEAGKEDQSEPEKNAEGKSMAASIDLALTL